ncbi:hypothetical protein E6C70_02120 [Glaciibacter flavus]|uniref:Uncharacterized protein n=1 Tax=Orlajensenia flava TaxID=2565934 RepID=A0A4S4FVV6_9MICO|nr:hypothetical protein [Glaciibacter flavus]THG34903.1 hypothetical protein E6C70_02120 [Glaciibacter flavus]
MRKYLFNGAIIGSIVGAWGVLQTTRKGPRDWRLILTWISWGLTLAVAVGTVKKEADDRSLSS